MRMLEQIARALAAEDHTMKAMRRINEKTYLRAMEEEWREWLPEARAALTALLTPTPEMVEAGERAIRENTSKGYNGRDDYFYGDSDDIWKAMISAALEKQA